MKKGKGVVPTKNKITTSQNGKFFFLGIGINNYKNNKNNIRNLWNPVLEITKISQILFDSYSFVDDSQHSKILLNEQATVDNFYASLKVLLQNMSSNDSLLIYFSGHGMADFWIPYDGDLERENTTCIALDSLKRTIKYRNNLNNSPRSIFVICDCCYSATLIATKKGSIDNLPKEYTAVSRQALCSCWEDDTAIEGLKGALSPFANAVIKVLKENTSKELTAAGFSELVKNLTLELTNNSQNPVFDRIPGCGDEKGQFYFRLKNVLKTITPQKTKSIINYTQDTLQELAMFLAYNYVNISFGNRYIDKNKNLTKDVEQEILQIKHKKFNHERCRNIAVIGAGMTYDAFNVLPFGSFMVEQIKNIIENNPKTVIDDDSKLELENRFKQATGFEEKLIVLAKYYKPQKVNSILKEIYGISFRPNLSFEIIAHLLKHGFLDAVINFNFDELLDKAIDSEIGPGTYFKVISEIDCVSFSEITIDGRIKIPLYIKPHGTASNPNSLTLDREILPGVENLIINLLNGCTDENNYTDKVETINLICIGFSMQSKTLNRIIQDSSERVNFNIYNFNTSDISKQITKESLFRVNGSQKNLYEETLKKVIDVSKVKLYKQLPYETNNVSIALYELWKEVKAFFKKPYQPRDICRHEIVTSLFYKKDYPPRKNYLDLKGEVNRLYFFDRTVIELAIIICRNKGLIDPKQITVDKFGRYFSKYMEYSKIENDGKDDLPFTLFDFLRHIFRMREHLSFSGNVYNPLDPTYNKKADKNLTGNEINRFMNDYPILLNAIKDVLLQEKNDRIRINNERITNIDKKEKELLEISNQAMIREFFKNLPLLILFRIVDGLRPDIFLHREKSRIENKETGKEYIRGKPYEYGRSILPNSIKEDRNLAQYLYRCFKKIYDRQMYDIHPKFHDPQLLIFDSFEKNNILNTEVSLLYEFMKMFKEFDKWDAMLIVSERGRFITEFAIDDLSQSDKVKLSKKKIINICCHDIMKVQLRDMRNNDIGLEDRYKRVILKINKDSNSFLNDMEILSLPYFIYEHHMCIFLKKPEQAIYEPLGLYKYLESNVSALYYYHRSFVHKINPVLLKLDEEKKDSAIYRQKLSLDLRKLLETYFALTQKARYFKINRFDFPIKHRPSPYSKDFCDLWDEEIYTFINSLFTTTVS